MFCSTHNSSKEMFLALLGTFRIHVSLFRVSKLMQTHQVSTLKFYTFQNQKLISKAKIDIFVIHITAYTTYYHPHSKIKVPSTNFND